MSTSPLFSAAGEECWIPASSARTFALADSGQPGVLGRAVPDGRQQGDLVLGPQHGVVRLLQVIEVVDEVADPCRHVVFLEPRQQREAAAEAIVTRVKAC